MQNVLHHITHRTWGRYRSRAGTGRWFCCRWAVVLSRVEEGGGGTVTSVIPTDFQKKRRSVLGQLCWSGGWWGDTRGCTNREDKTHQILSVCLSVYLSIYLSIYLEFSLMLLLSQKRYTAPLRLHDCVLCYSVSLYPILCLRRII